MGRNKTAEFQNNNIIWNIPYTPGTIEAVGYNNGEEVARQKLVTSGNTSACTLSVDRKELTANGTDVANVAITLVDKDGNKVSTDDKIVTVSVEGNARLLALDNGDLRREKHFGGDMLPTYFGRALVVLQAGRKAGKARLKIGIEGVEEPYYVDFEIKSQIASKK
jgi:beta-galactosidase